MIGFGVAKTPEFPKIALITELNITVGRRQNKMNFYILQVINS